MNFCTRLLCALAKTPPDVFIYLFFLPDFSSVKIFRKMWTHLRPFFFGKKEYPPPAGQTSEWAYRTHVPNFRVYLSKTAWTFGLSCVKMSTIRYVLQFK